MVEFWIFPIECTRAPSNNPSLRFPLACVNLKWPKVCAQALVARCQATDSNDCEEFASTDVGDHFFVAADIRACCQKPRSAPVLGRSTHPKQLSAPHQHSRSLRL